MKIRTSRIYDEEAQSKEFRVLIDRLWPRGISKEKAQIDFWAKDLAPSDELREWYRHDHSKWDEFRARYEKELSQQPTKLVELIDLIKGKEVVLLYVSKETEKNNATAMKLYLENLLQKS